MSSASTVPSASAGLQFAQRERAPKLPRISSGNPELDAVLHGGFPKNSINIIMGEPGCGKTVLAECLIFTNAESSERPILYLTTLSEPLEKMVHYLQQFSFFDAEKLATGAILYDSMGQELQEQGIAAVVPKLKEVIKTLSPKIVVIDSFKAIHDLATSPQEMRRMLYELTGFLTAYDTTTFLIGEYNEAMIAVLPEFAIADGMIELARKKTGLRDERYLRVLKMRGSSYQEGLHAFRLTTAGLAVFPRLTSPEAPSAYTSCDARISTGVANLDTMLQGGLLAGSSTLVQGVSGSGKTTLALQFVLEGLRRQEPGLYLNFQENPTQLARQIESLGWDIATVDAKGLHRLYTSPAELQIDSILLELFQVIQQKKIKRVAIDALGDLVSAAGDQQRLLNYLYALLQHFVVGGIASVLTLETAATGAAPVLGSERSFVGQMSAFSDAILTLDIERRGDTVRRTLQVVKARATQHDLNVRELHITPNGVEVL
jgi:circadian clock protein KaiC